MKRRVRNKDLSNQIKNNIEIIDALVSFMVDIYEVSCEFMN